VGEQVTIISLIAAAGAVSAVVFGYIGYSRGIKKDNYSEGTERGSLKSDITYISETLRRHALRAKRHK